MAIEQAANVRSLLIPIGDKQILLPSAVIAEIAPYAEPEPFAEDSSLLGTVEWRQQIVPVLSIQHLFQLPEPKTTLRQRLVVLYGLEAVSILPFYAFVASGVPRTVTTTEESLSTASNLQMTGLTCELSAKIPDHDDAIAWIPDLTFLENTLRKSPQLLAKIAQA
ncbi:chemotaxis protein CheW [Candidatus Albibeggiatoa sp. nov. NOAA]|uniref:chemotaxis protein CheW n=1 Tax=Candidatus Albibeggiatoa sp. nov. NOAA TaxID=3162724 RepID=UPI0032FD52D1|nr:chemotaxis protein CheW [Thiotrichaceae bacterium]